MSGQSRAVQIAERVVAAVDAVAFVSVQTKTAIANAVIDAVTPIENELAAVRAWPKPYRSFVVDHADEIRKAVLADPRAPENMVAPDYGDAP